MTKPLILDSEYTPVGSELDPLTFLRSQDIPDEHLSQLADYRHGTKHQKSGEFHRVASIPVAVIDQWSREGFDINKATAKEIVARLRRENLQAFITTEKAI